MSDFQDFYRSREALLQRTCNAATGLISSLLEAKEIEYLSVSGRVKSLTSCLEKIVRKQYKKPSESITDLVGIRVIVYFKHQLSEVEEIIRTNCSVDENNSSSKDADLGDDRIGYRSTHLVCTFDRSRSSLIEYRNVSGQRFEIQIRTVLQHAWAELAHDRAYKLSGGLPKKIQREVNLYAGMLEIADSSFSKIVKEIDLYKKDIEFRNIDDKQINVLTVNRLIEDISNANNLKFRDKRYCDDVIIGELANFGFENIGSLRKAIDSEFIEATKRYQTDNTDAGFLRDLMMWIDPNKYFSKCWKGSWNGVDGNTQEMIEIKHPNFALILEEFAIDIDDDFGAPNEDD
jgi:ppGpp synthetase/RelA/SpoT-type nucleotidyltranferase